MPVRDFERFVRALLCPCPPISVCFPFPTKQTLYQPHKLPLRLAILSWVESFLYASVKVVWLDWLATTVRHGCERHAIISVVLEAFLSSIFSMSSDDISACTSAEVFMDWGIMDLPPRLPLFGFVARVAL